MLSYCKGDPTFDKGGEKGYHLEVRFQSAIRISSFAQRGKNKTKTT